MAIHPGPGEPVAGPWRPLTPQACLVELLGPEVGTRPERVVVAVDGRSGAGKSTLAGRLRSALADLGASPWLVATDDVAWHAPMFGWAPWAAQGVLEPFRRGEAVRFRPPAWTARERPGHIEVPADASVLLLEGVGASQRALAPLVDVAVWVQSDLGTAERLGIARDVAAATNGDEAASVAFWHGWMAHETPFLASDRPWERADLLVAGVGVPRVGAADDDLLVARASVPG